MKNRLHSIWALIFAKAEFKAVLKFNAWQNGTWKILHLIYRIAKFSKRVLSGIWGILALQNTENGLLNAEFVDFSLFAGLFMAHYTHFLRGSALLAFYGLPFCLPFL